MKYLKSIPFVLALTLMLGSCEKQENKVYFEGGTEPVLTSTKTVVVLDPKTETQEILRLNWTNPDYAFTTGVSSQDVNYTLEMDTLGGNFASGAKYAQSISRELVRSFTGFELNSILGNSMLLKFGKAYTIETRVISSLGTGAVPLTSNKVSYTVTPYAPPPKVPVPEASTLWATGNAFESDWANPLPSPYDASQKFTKVSSTVYELTVAMKGGGNYKLIQEQGNWGTQYHMITGGTWEGGSLEKKDADPGFIGAPTAGNYKIRVDFQLGTFTVVKQ
jgi:starch-binding outer membrane protein SusE/F